LFRRCLNLALSRLSFQPFLPLLLRAFLLLPSSVLSALPFASTSGLWFWPGRYAYAAFTRSPYCLSNLRLRMSALFSASLIPHPGARTPCTIRCGFLILLITPFCTPLFIYAPVRSVCPHILVSYDMHCSLSPLFVGGTFLGVVSQLFKGVFVPSSLQPVALPISFVVSCPYTCFIPIRIAARFLVRLSFEHDDC
jgi:hypothetical protein